MTAVPQALPTRRYDLPGVYNLRDTGGYRTEAGTTRWRRLFRSDALHLLDDAGRSLLAELGVARIVDLRGAEEVRTAPSRLDGSGIRVQHVPILDEAAPGEMPLSLIAVYDRMIDERGAHLVAAIRAIAEEVSQHAVLVHCTAGKDRTGLVIALTLSAVGVDRDEIVADYAQTADNLRGEWAERMLDGYRRLGGGLTDDVVELVTSSPAPVLAALLERIDREYGSVRGYLVAHGLTVAEQESLATALIDRPRTPEKDAS